MPFAWLRFALALAITTMVASTVMAQGAPDSKRPFEITDNSFLVEEAFNQERAVFQNIFSVMRSSDGRWDGSFTQEWPMLGQQHQLSYTVPFTVMTGGRGVGDVLINYRYQLLEEGERRPAFSPRLSAILPTGSRRDGFGSGVLGWQVNLPFSKQLGDVYFHWNGGVTYLPGMSDPDAEEITTSLTSPFVAGSAIVRVRPMLNVMCEVVSASNESLVEPGVTQRSGAFTVSPGIRGGWNVGDHQIVVGVAVPMTWQDGDRGTGLLTYFSYELPFGPR